MVSNAIKSTYSICDFTYPGVSNEALLEALNERVYFQKVGFQLKDRSRWG